MEAIYGFKLHGICDLLIYYFLAKEYINNLYFISKVISIELTLI